MSPGIPPWPTTVRKGQEFGWPRLPSSDQLVVKQPYTGVIVLGTLREILTSTRCDASPVGSADSSHFLQDATYSEGSIRGGGWSRAS